ncbi:YihY/virulence factor BrkB family protein [Leekyejoonella antrihumi]|nr:YihY/virulence factor BrkB family protein [Leekyejoonella antrihumi]
MTLLTDPDIERPEELPEAKAKPSWKVALKRAGAKFSQDQCTDKAAALTYFSVQSIFPGLIAVLSLLNIFGNGARTTKKLVAILAGVLGKQPSDFSQVTDFINHAQSQGGGGIALAVGILGALWSASGYVGGFSRALNKIYDIGEGRPVWKLRPTLLLVTAIEIVLIVIVIVALVTSGSVAREIGKQIGLGTEAVQIWDLAKWPVVAFIVVFIIGMLYWATPNVRKMKRNIFSWGALTAFIVWVVGSIALVLYVGFTHGSGYQKTYGAFAYVILFLLWLWITNLAMLFGAELDAELIRTRQLRAGFEAERIVLLPARDESGLEKKEDKQKKLLKEATALRMGETVAAGAAGGGALATRGNRDTGNGAGGNRKDKKAMGTTKQQDMQETRAQISRDRVERRDKALAEAKAERKVRDRLERQEAKKKKKFNDALKQVKAERKAREAAVTYPQHRASIEETRAKYAPRQTPARERLEAEQRARRASYDADQAEQRAKAAAQPPEPPKPKKVKEKKPPMPSEARTQVEMDKTQRRLAWFAEHKRGE